VTSTSDSGHAAFLFDPDILGQPDAPLYEEVETSTTFCRCFLDPEGVTTLAGEPAPWASRRLVKPVDGAALRWLLD
jgi:hypothetical protein